MFTYHPTMDLIISVTVNQTIQNQQQNSPSPTLTTYLLLHI